MQRSASFIPLIVLSTLLGSPALAHTGQGASGVYAGIMHPITGLDHVVAMVAVGLWGGILGKPALWQLPIAFPVIMAVAGAFGVAGVPLPGVEVGIALSGMVLGAMVLFAVQMPVWAAMMIVGVFAVFHGHAHGAELPSAANPMAFALGFVLSTGTLHLCGIMIGGLGRWPVGRVAVRATGAAIALAGTAFLTGIA
jgi:urease accessory protein